MKKFLFISLAGLASIFFLLSIYTSSDVKSQSKSSKTPGYIVMAWNDLGMHCANKICANLCILPPYNNQRAQIVLQGDASNLPQVLSTGYHVNYSVPGNTYSVGKTDFWTYANALFGVTLANNVGLTGVGLTGNMSKTGNHFYVDGIPATPYPDNDLVNEHPYQLTLIQAYDTNNNLLGSTQSVIPVSGDISCVSSGCHSSEANILNSHESVAGFNPANTPILCASCHQDNALGTPGIAGAPPFSQAIHQAHGGETNDCYKCHPGQNTSCLRDTMHTAGMVCQDCHGSVANVGNTVASGRQPWIDEPTCAATSCHGANFATEPGKLFKLSEGHGGLFCSACHGSPHAIVPTTQANDNVQNIAIQGFKGTLRKCTVCHGVNPTGAGPHGFFASTIEYDPSTRTETMLEDVFPNPVINSANLGFTIGKETRVTLQIFDQLGKRVRLFIEQRLIAGKYNVSVDVTDLPAGNYFYSLQTTEKTYAKKMLIIK